MGGFEHQRCRQLPHAGHLAQVLAKHEFQEALQKLRDLQFWRAPNQWQESWELNDMLVNTARAFASGAGDSSA